MPVFVTGGSGVVGVAVVRHLVAAGHQVRALSRSDRSDAILAGLGALPIRGEVMNANDFVPDMEGCSLLFHVAGVNEMCSSDPDRMIMTNVEGSLRVLRSAARAGVARMVYTSSAAAIGEADGVVATEASSHRGYYLSAYERSKHLAEQAVMSESTMVEVVSVNPSSVQGPGRAVGSGKLILDLVAGRLPALVDTVLSIVDIDDCARGHLLAAERGKAGERYILSSFTLEMRQAVRLISEALGRDLKVRYLPGWMAMAGAAVIESGSRLVGRQPPVCREMITTMLHGHRYDGSRATRELGLTYTTAPDLLRRLVMWFEVEGLLDG